ncbi:MAG: sensor histidine kinase [Acidimicrobiales bacterium]
MTAVDRRPASAEETWRQAPRPGRRDLVAWAAHDLRSPLARIVAMAEALEDGVVAEPKDVARYLRTMRREAGRVAAMFDDLLLLCRLRGGALRLSRVPAPLDELVAEAVAGAAVLAAPKGVVVRDRVGEPRPVAAVSTPEISRVLQNLLDNAVRHTPAGGLVSVETNVATGGSWAVVSVQDACGGMAPEDLAHAFDGGSRRSTTGRAGSGPGLGLLIAHGLTAAHGGDISVHNQAGGCRFTVRLPLAHNERNREGMDRG